MNTRRYVALAAIVAMSFIMLLAEGTKARAQSGRNRLLTRHVHEEVSGGQAALVGQKQEAEQLDVTMLLALRNQRELDSLLRELYDVNSPNYRHFLSVQEFTDRFGPTEEHYRAVLQFAEENGLAVTATSPNRLVVKVRGAVGSINAAFHVTLNEYQHPTENRIFYAPDREPTVDLDVPVWHVGGLNDFATPHALYHKEAVDKARSNTTGSGPGGSFLGSDRRAAYAPGTTLNGAGQAVGLFQLGGYNLSDVQAYFRNVGQPLNVPINNVLLDGASAGSTGDDTEQVIDIIEAVSMAPGLSQVRVYIAKGGNSFRPGVDDVDILNQMATENIAKQLSCSWSWKPSDAAHDEPLLHQMMAQGQSFFVASGDAGSWVSGGFIYPAESTLVTAVGGTVLTTNGPGGRWASESAWPGSGGGIAPDQVFIPAYQSISAVLDGRNGASSTKRNGPDVAAEANTDNYFCANGTCGGGLGGTSLAAPTWAGLLALANQQAANLGKTPVGFINPVIYPIGASSSYTTDFHDITSGSNGGFSAVSGFDLVTGWGSPNTNMINALATAQETATGLLGLMNEFCDSSGNCSEDTISVTVNNTTEVINFGPNFGNDGTLQTITSLIASAFNTDPSSPVTATSAEDLFSITGDGWDVFFTANQAGITGNYPTNLSVSCSFICNGFLSTGWTWSADPRTGYALQNGFTSSSPFAGSLTGGR